MTHAPIHAATRRGSAPGFTLVELLVVIAIISLIAGFLIPTLLRGRVEANKVKCKSNLRQIVTSAMSYADTSGTRFFPYGKGSSPPAHESLNEMVAIFPELKPDLFICPEWRGNAASTDDKNKFTLDDLSCAYTWTKTKLAPTDAGFAISSDKYIKDKDKGRLDGHDGGMNVVYTDAAVDWEALNKINDKDKDGDNLIDTLVR